MAPETGEDESKMDQNKAEVIMLLEPVNTAKARQLLNQRMALVLAGGRGSRLKQLTDNRAKPAVHFGGKFRIIDFVLSNCINSGIRRVGVVTQYKSHSLLRHLQSGWSFLRYQMNEFIDLLPAQQRVPRYQCTSSTRCWAGRRSMNSFI